MIERSDRYIFFLRPLGFGKNLLVDMLQHYYDVCTREKFDVLFGDLYIGQQPTRDHNAYLVLYLNFSGIDDGTHNYRRGLDEECRVRFDYFCDVYAEYLPQDIKEKLIEKKGAID